MVDPNNYCHAEAHLKHKVDEAELSEEVLVSTASYLSVIVQSYVFTQDFISQGQKARRQGRRSKRQASPNILSPTVLASALEAVCVAFLLTV